jgi:uncharacterized Rossmann fold enzyme
LSVRFTTSRAATCTVKCDEFAFRYSTRTAMGYTDGERAAELVLGAEGSV